jgi:hypothetical protein
VRRSSLSPVLLAAALAVALVLALAGCGGGSASKTSPSTSPKAQPDAATKPLKAAAEEDPTEEICDTMIKQAVTDIVRLPYTVSKSKTPTESVCTYTFASGSLLLRVHTATTNSDANAYFDGLRKDAGKTTTLALGSPAFLASNGTTVMVKDNLVLVVDPTKAPDSVDRENTSESLAAEVLSCWVG